VLPNTSCGNKISIGAGESCSHQRLNDFYKISTDLARAIKSED